MIANRSVLSGFLMAASTALAADGPQRADIDFAACRSFAGGVAKPATEAEVASVLGLPKSGNRPWSAGKVEGKEPIAFTYVIAFTRAVAAGTVFVDAECELFALRDGAAAPGDPTKADDWVDMGGGLLRHGRPATLPPGAKVRGLLIKQTRKSGTSELKSVRLIAPRWADAAPWALAYADREYVPPLTDYKPYPASAPIDGRGKWLNAGKDNNGFIPAPPLSEIHTSWYLLAWKQERTISGLWLRSNLTQFTVETFDGRATVHPRTGTASEWQRLRDVTSHGVSSGQSDSLRWVAFPPVRTRGLRLVITKSNDGPVASISGIRAFTDLGDAPVPEVPKATAEAPPFQIALDLPADGNLTLAIDGADGVRARNLITRGKRPAGQQSIGWNLLDENGAVVEPGTYTWTAVAWPDLQLKWDATVYPSVTGNAPGNAPWLTGNSGAGGWMADHTPPISGAARGDRIWLGSTVAESGVSLIECDLEGRKLWGHHSFAAWTGARFIAADDKTVYVASPILGSTVDAVWAVDRETHKVRQLLSLTPTSQRRRGMQGLAVADGKLYLSVRGQESHLVGAASADDVDVLACKPFYPEKRKPRVAYEVVPDPRGDFLKLFRLGGLPPGGAAGNNTLTQLATEGVGGARKHIVLAFKKPVALGGVVLPVPVFKDGKFILSTLKPGAEWPPDPQREADWVPFEHSGKLAWDAVPAPANTTTRALRVSFVKGTAADNDPLAGLLDEPKGKKDDLFEEKKGKTASLEFGGTKEEWRGKLEGMKLLRRRFANVAGEAKVLVNSGSVADDGSWDARRTAPLTEADPGVYALVWKTEQSLRGLAVREIDGELTLVDAWVGSGEPDPVAAAGWEQVAQYKQARRDYYQSDNYNATARYLDGYIDFGKDVSTRAVRLRVVRQWADKGSRGTNGVRQDQGGQTVDPSRCRIYGVAALKYLGGEPPTDAAAAERVEVYDANTGKALGEFAAPAPGQIAIAGDGSLLAISKNAVVRLDPSGKDAAPLINDLQSPSAFTVDRAGSVYVFDAGRERHQIRIYDAKGAFVRAIGTAGGFRVGPWDPTRLGSVSSLAVDGRGQIWAVETQYHPKRVTVWTPDGKLVRELLGNTPYGGGGVLDPQDTSRIFYGPLEFELDRKTGASRIKNYTWMGSMPAGEVPIRVGNRTYLVTRPQFSEMPLGVVFLYDGERLKPVAAIGLAAAFEPLKRGDMTAALGGKALPDHTVIWCDRDGDGQVQAGEVTLARKPDDLHGLTNFKRDLSARSGRHAWKVREFLDNGAPVFEMTSQTGLVGRSLYAFDDGSIFRLGDGRLGDAGMTAAGKVRWSYPTEGSGVQALHHAKPWKPEQVVAQFGIVGHERTDALGEFIVMHGNTGAWNVRTADGLLIGPIFRDFRSPGAKPWSMPLPDRGTVLTDLTAGEEHFMGYFCKSADGRFHVVAGHNHISVCEVIGLDKCVRLRGTVTVTADDVKRAREWNDARTRDDVYARSPVIDCFKLGKPPALDGKLTGFGSTDAEIDEDAQLRMGWDDTHLYVGVRTRDLGPLANSGTELERLFKTGAALDLHLETDPTAASDRRAPAAGDVRLLITFVGKKPAAVLYRPVVPGTPADKAFRVTSPVGETTIDRVVEPEGLRIVRGGEGNGWTLEAAIPLSALGLKPTPGLRVKMDWGVLVAGPGGTEVLKRIYWADRSVQIVSDAPSEARLHPDRWGHLRFLDRRSDEGRLDTIDPIGKPKTREGVDILEDLKPKPN